MAWPGEARPGLPLRLFIQAGWYPLCTRLGGSHQGVAQEFDQTSNGQEATIFGFKLQVSEQSIVEALTFPRKEKSGLRDNSL